MGQKAWVVPEQFNPGDSITVFVDVSKADCQRLLNTTADVFMWTWEPGDPVLGNGNWTASNPDMKMTRDDANPNIYYMKMVPNQFYVLGNESEIYSKGISFLAKLADGTGGGGGGCDEDKTEDLHIDASPIPGCNTKFCQFPSVVFWDDYFTFLYDNGLEDKALMKESVVGVDNFSMYIRVVYDDGTKGTYTKYGEVKNHPELALVKNADDYYSQTFVFADLLKDLVVPGKTITAVEIQVMDKNYSNGPNSVSNGNHFVTVGCN
tara:strand:+ start:51214 stop:52005 length:792 start_codon:yes stop_codon:yes gene_type:complete